MRLARLGPTILLVAALSLAACTTSEPGWTYAAPPSETPIPSLDASAAAPSGEASAPASGAPSAGAESPAASGGAGGTVVQVSASGIKFEQATLDVPADNPFTLEFANNDAGIPHDVDIRDSGGASLFKTEIFPGVETRSYDAPPLPAGAYQFVCTVHPTMIIDATAG
jgi:plastocyanin